MRAHHDAVDLPLARECKNLVGGQSGPHHHLALKASVLYLLSHRLKMMLLCPRGGGIVVVADTRGLRRGHHQRVVCVEKNEVRTEFLGLGKCKREGLLVGGNLGGKKNGGGFAPSGFHDGGHGHLLWCAQTIADTLEDSQCPAAHEMVT